MREGHRRGSATRSDRTQARDVTEHLSQRHRSLHQASTRRRAIHTFDLTTTLVEVTDDITHVFLRRIYLQVHDRLEQDRASLSRCILEGLDSADFEGKLVGVHGVERTVEERYLQLIHSVASEYPIGHSLLEALLYGGDEFLRYVTALDFVYEL